MVEDSLKAYKSSLYAAFQKLSPAGRRNTPIREVGSQIHEMISCYLKDAESFRNCDDLVNTYASLTYAHGWLDAGIFIGYFDGDSPSLYLSNDATISSDQIDKLQEKRSRYENMLRIALKSVKIAPESGSPCHHGAVFIYKRAVASVEYAQKQGVTDCAALGSLSYGYGWLDTGIRAGLFQILTHPELFTTDTC